MNCDDWASLLIIKLSIPHCGVLVDGCSTWTLTFVGRFSDGWRFDQVSTCCFGVTVLIWNCSGMKCNIFVQWKRAEMKTVRPFAPMNTVRFQARWHLGLTGFSVLIADAPRPARPSFACWFSWRVWTGSELNGGGGGLIGMMEVAAAAPWTDMFESERNQVSGRAETLLGSSSLTLAPLMADSASVRRSQPIFITSNRFEGRGHSNQLLHESQTSFLLY